MGRPMTVSIATEPKKAEQRTSPAARDPHRFVNELDDAMIERLIARLESRGKDEVFTRLFARYADKLSLPKGSEALEIGSGTGVVTRGLAQRADVRGRLTGVDQSPIFVEKARGFAAAEGVTDQVAFEVGDAHALPFDDRQFDVVIAHTLISHVTDPAAVLAEAYRVLKPGGTLVVFDGDYASLTYGYTDSESGRAMDWALARATFNNPVVMRQLPDLLADAGLTLSETLADAVSEIGQGSFFRSMAETYAPLIAKGGLSRQEDVDAWLSYQREAMDSGRFFGACTYYSIIARRPG